jgi:hypothetical protein
MNYQDNQVVIQLPPVTGIVMFVTATEVRMEFVDNGQ